MYSHYFLWFCGHRGAHWNFVKWLRCFGPTGIHSPTRSQTISLFCLIVGFVVSLNFPWRNRDTHGYTQEMFVAVLLHRTVPTCRYIHFISDCDVISWVDNNQSKQACKFGKTEGQIVLATGFGCQLDTRLMASSQTDPTNMFLPRIHYYILEIGRVNPN